MVYRKKYVRRVVLYVSGRAFVFTTRSDLGGRVRRCWLAGGRTEGCSVRVRASDVARLLLGREEACRKPAVLDRLFRDAVREGFKVHGNDYFVQLWLSKPLGEVVGERGEVDVGRLGDCVKCFSWSFGRFSVVTPPWCCDC